MTGTGAVWTAETTWNWGSGAGSSGGISSYYAIPNWQMNSSAAASSGSSAWRNIPDVALTSDNIYAIDSNGYNDDDTGGTSASAPLWAGFLALANQQAVSEGKSAIGFINPPIYEIASQSLYAAAFHDITNGNNTWSSSTGQFYAGPGFDLCTGLGTPNGSNLIAAFLYSDPLIVSTNYGFAASGWRGGPFSVGTQIFSLTNTSAAALAWGVSNVPPWLTVSATGGVLAAHGSTTLVAGLNSIASNLVLGAYYAGVWWTNLTSGVGQVRNFTLQVTDQLAPVTANGFSAFGPVGGPFAPASQTVTLTNTGAAAVSWSLINTTAWLNVSSTGGVVPGNGTASVTASLGSGAAGLPAGTYNASLVLSNPVSQAAWSIPFQFLPGQSVVQNGGFAAGGIYYCNPWVISSNAVYTYVDDGTASGVTPQSGGDEFIFGQVGDLRAVFLALQRRRPRDQQADRLVEHQHRRAPDSELREQPDLSRLVELRVCGQRRQHQYHSRVRRPGRQLVLVPRQHWRHADQ
jgi:hypothetical protein